jgi:hypothetical protein
MYGAAHGGEANGWRATWSTEPALPEGIDVLGRLQAKVCAPYCDTAVSRDRFALQIDNALRVTVDRALWGARRRRPRRSPRRAARLDAATPRRAPRSPTSRLAPARERCPRPAAMTRRVARPHRPAAAPLKSAAWYRLIARDLYEIQTGDTSMAQLAPSQIPNDFRGAYRSVAYLLRARSAAPPSTTATDHRAKSFPRELTTAPSRASTSPATPALTWR